MDEPIPENITQELYKRNAELAIRNKTLSLLGKLYEISILTLEPAALAKNIVESIQTQLDFNLVGIFHYHDHTDQLVPLYFAKSESIKDILGDKDKVFESIAITKVSKHELFKDIFSGERMTHTENLEAIWDGFVGKEKLDAIREQGRVHTLLLYPLVVENKKILGVLMIGINRAYNNLAEFEQESIHSFVNVIAIALDKALLYQQLEVVNRKLADANSDLNDANNELKRLDQTKTEFMSIASHQLRTPLTVIKGYISMILEGTFGKIPKKSVEALERTAFSTEQLIKLVNEFLNLSRIESGKIQYNVTANDINQIITEVVGELKQQAKEKGIVFRLGLGDIPQFMFDRDKMREIILNYVHNAFKYTPKGRVDVKSEIVKKTNGEFVRISVSDEGMGISKEDVARLFQKFIRTEQAKASDPNGMGLGLYLVKKVAEDHGGSVWAESEGLGKGSTFILELPLKK